MPKRRDDGNVAPGGGSDPLLTAVAGFCGLVLGLALFYPLLRGNLYQGSDLAAFHLPARAFYAECLQAGQRPLWQPAQFCGYYLHGEGQVGMFHPAHWAIYRFLPLDWAFNLELASGYIFAWLGMAALLRRWRLPWFAALFGANAFAFSGFMLLHFMHMQAIEVIAHLPWLVLAAEALYDAADIRAARRAWAAIALLSASQLLLGYPQYVIMTLLALGIQSVFRWRRTGWFGRTAALVAALVIGLLIAGAQVIPTFDQLGEAMRRENPDAWKSGSLHPLNLLQWAGPWWFENRLSFGTPPWEYGLYTGVAPLLLGLSLLFPCGARRVLAWLGTLALVALVLALGEYGGAYALIAKLPVLGAFRCSARHIVLIHFALAALAALALARIGGGERWGHRWIVAVVCAAWLTLGLATLLRALGPEVWRDAFAPGAVPLVIGPALVSAAAAILALARRNPRTGVALLMALATVDTLGHAIPFVRDHAPQSTSLDGLREAIARELPAEAIEPATRSNFRAHGNWRVARLTQVGLANYQGYVGLPPSWTLDPEAESTKRLAGVRWEKRPLHATEWTLRKDALPRARLVTEVTRSDRPREDIDTIDLARSALVTRELALDGGAAGVVTWVRDDPGALELECAAGSRQLLVLSERHHPGCRASISGESVEVLPVNGDFMGCVVPEGVHRVRFTFAPASFRLGAWLSVAGMLLLAMGYLGMARATGDKKRGPDTPGRDMAHP